MLTRIASYNELQNLWLALQSIVKLSLTTGAILSPLIFYAARKLVRADRVPTHDLCWNLGSVENVKGEERRAA